MSVNEEENNLELPPSTIWNNICKISITEDKPIMMDYWTDSLEKKVVIGVKENKEKLLVKNSEEYTSPIAKIFKMDNVYIICTENSIYLVSSSIESRRISS